MIDGFALGDIAYIVGKIMISVFMVIHILAMIVLIRQAMLTSRVIVTEGNKSVLLFSYVHVIILIVVLLVIIFLPAI